MRKLQKLLSYLLVAVLSAMITLSVFAGTPDEEYRKLDEVRELIETYYIGTADRAAMEDAAAAAMVNSLGDRWSHYMSAKEYLAYEEQMKNAYVGVGITIQQREDGIGFDVIKVNEGGPAEAAGMIAGDVIIAIEGQPTEGMTTAEARDLVRGQKGKDVHLSVRRGEEVLELTVARETVETPVVQWQLLESGIGQIIIYNFDDRCARETIAAIETLTEQGAQALIFDVRGNPGGYKHELVELLDYLLPEGPLFRSEDYTGKVLVDESDKKYLDIPMAVLVDENSYSAAEFFAAALDEYDAAVVVGVPTTGKGNFQSTFQLADGSALTISVGKYTTPKGVNLAEVGVTPEIIVEVDEQTAKAIYAETIGPEEDPQLQAAVQALLAE